MLVSNINQYFDRWVLVLKGPCLKYTLHVSIQGTVKPSRINNHCVGGCIAWHCKYMFPWITYILLVCKKSVSNINPYIDRWILVLKGPCLKYTLHVSIQGTVKRSRINNHCVGGCIAWHCKAQDPKDFFF